MLPNHTYCIYSDRFDITSGTLPAFLSFLTSGYGSTIGAAPCLQATSGSFAPGGLIGAAETNTKQCVTTIGGSSTNTAYVTVPATGANSSSACQCAAGKAWTLGAGNQSRADADKESRGGC